LVHLIPEEHLVIVERLGGRRDGGFAHGDDVLPRSGVAVRRPDLRSEWSEMLAGLACAERKRGRTMSR
jgi:hypothetical protein